MTLEEFLIELDNDTKKTIIELNIYLRELKLKNIGIKNFQNKKYNFPWSKIRNILKDKGYVFNRVNGMLEKTNNETILTTEDIITLKKMIKNYETKSNYVFIYEPYTDIKTTTFRLSEKVIEEFRELCNKFSQYSQADLLSHILQEGMNKYK